MKKSDLKAGYLVEYRCGVLGVLMPIKYFGEDTLAVIRDLGDMSCQEIGFWDNALYAEDIEKDIVKVYDLPEDSKNRTWLSVSKEARKLLWERKETPKMSIAERTLLENLDDIHRWIARDKGGELYLYGQKPKKDTRAYWGNTSCFYFPYENLFSFIKWEDEEPYCIEELLE